MDPYPKLRGIMGLPKGDSYPPPCPKCAAIAVTAKEIAEDRVVWFTCKRCKHTWCAVVGESQSGDD